MDRELSACLLFDPKLKELEHLETAPMLSKAATNGQRLAILAREDSGDALFAKPYLASAVASRVESNHDGSNLRFVATAAERPLKDRVYRRFHNLQQTRVLFPKSTDSQHESVGPAGSLEAPQAEPAQPQSLQLWLDGKEVALTQGLVGSVGLSTLLSLATESKRSSMALQEFVRQADGPALAQFVALVSEHLPALLTDKFGSYLVQALVLRHLAVRSRVQAACQRDFHSLVHNEYSSRVMQRLIEVSPDFRGFAMQTFKHDLKSFIQSVSACYLISVGILNSQSESERDVVSEFLSKRSISWTANKYFKKTLICYLSACSEEKLNYMHRKLLKKRSVLWYLTEKFACLILLKFVERNHAPTKRLVLNKIKKDPVGVSKLSYFGYFAGEAAKLDAVHGLADGLHAVLTSSLSRAQHQSLLQELVVYQIFCGAVSVTYPSRQAAQQASRPRQIDAAQTNRLP
jgi:hypothetical protein